MKILLSGYTYTRENLFEVFESYPRKEDLYFILPSNWREKGGKVRYQSFKKPGFNIYHSPALFFKKLVVKANIALSDGALCGQTKAENILRGFGGDVIIGQFLHDGFNEDR